MDNTHKRKHLIITKEELEALEIKADQKLLQSILRAEEDIKKGRLYSHREIFNE